MYQVLLSLFYVDTNYVMVAQRENWSLQEQDEIYLVFGAFFFFWCISRLYSVPLIYLSILAEIVHCLVYGNFVTVLKSSRFSPPALFFSLKTGLLS